MQTRCEKCLKKWTFCKCGKTPNTSRESVPQIPMESVGIANEQASQVVEIMAALSGIQVELLRILGLSAEATSLTNARLKALQLFTELHTAPSVPSPTEALTASGVSLDKYECPFCHEVLTRHELFHQTRCWYCDELLPPVGKVLQPPPSPSPMVSVEEWTHVPATELKIEHILISKGVRTDPYVDPDKTIRTLKEATELHNASLASLTAEIERLKQQPRCGVCNGELSQCGAPSPDGDPEWDCKICQLRAALAAAEQGHNHLGILHHPPREPWPADVQQYDYVVEEGNGRVILYNAKTMKEECRWITK